MRFALSLLATLGVAFLAARGALREAAPQWDGYPLPGASDGHQLPNLVEQAAVIVNPSTHVPAGVPEETAARNVRAFLHVIKTAEGTAGRGDNGYNILFGGATFQGYADHPRKRVTRSYFNTRTQRQEEITSTAAGAYQILERTWDPIARRLFLPDFTPASQDAAAIELIREWGALRDVQGGRFATAIGKVRLVWASLPGAGYGQPERRFTDLAAVFSAAGGTRSTDDERTA